MYSDTCQKVYHHVLHNISRVWRQRCMQDRNNMSRISSPLALCFINVDNRFEWAQFSYDAVRKQNHVALYLINLVGACTIHTLYCTACSQPVSGAIIHLMLQCCWMLLEPAGIQQTYFCTLGSVIRTIKSNISATIDILQAKKKFKTEKAC